MEEPTMVESNGKNDLGMVKLFSWMCFLYIIEKVEE